MQGKLEGEEAYEALDKIDRLEVFEVYIRCSPHCRLTYLFVGSVEIALLFLISTLQASMPWAPALTIPVIMHCYWVVNVTRGALCLPYGSAHPKAPFGHLFPGIVVQKHQTPV